MQIRLEAFLRKVLTDKQTNKRENITSLVEVTKQHMSLLDYFGSTSSFD